MKELIEELKNNQKIKNTECVRIDYIIERLEGIIEDTDNYLEDRINFLNTMINYSVQDNKDKELYEYSMRKYEVENVKEYIEGVQNDNI